MEAKSADKRRIPLWEKRTEALRRSGSLPRDFYTKDWTLIENLEPGSPLREHVRCLWMSDVFLDKHPVCPGFRYEIYEPVTADVAAELGIRPPGEPTPEGFYRQGDAVLYWAPEEVAKQQDEVFLSGANVRERLKAQREELHEKLGEDLIGDVTVTNDFNEMKEAGKRNLRELGSNIKK